MKTEKKNAKGRSGYFITECEVMLVCRNPGTEKHRQNGKFFSMCLHTTGTNNLGMQGLPVKSG